MHGANMKIDDRPSFTFMQNRQKYNFYSVVLMLLHRIQDISVDIFTRLPGWTTGEEVFNSR